MEKRTKIISLLAFLFSSIGLFAQSEIEKNIEVGMWVSITPCSGQMKSYTSMDLYTKTRYLASDTIAIDSSSGNGVFDYFFKPGDFDAKRLPCDYGKKQYKVAALHVFETKEGNEKRVMILYTKDPFTVIWVEFDKAVELQEITW